MQFIEKRDFMECLCRNQNTKAIKIEADVGADPVWCNICGCNLELENLPISNELSEQLSKWVTHYGQWLDFEREQLFEGGEELELVHNHLGERLAEKLERELDDSYDIQYVKTTSSLVYKELF